MSSKHDERPASVEELQRELRALREILQRSSGIMIQSTDVKLREAGTMINRTLRNQDKRR